MGNGNSRPSVIHTTLRIVNNTHTDITSTSVYVHDNNHWRSQENRPDRNFQNVFIRARSSREAKENINGHTTENTFTMTLHFRNSLKDTFQINQRYGAHCPEPRFWHSDRSHDITYRKAGNNTLEVTVNNTSQQLDNIQAEKLQQDGLKEMKRRRYEAAKRKFDEALKKANESKTITSIRANRSEAERKLSNQKAQQLQSEAQAAFNQRSYQTAIDKYNRALALANEAATINSIKSGRSQAQNKLINQKAVRLNDEGEALMRAGKFTAANNKFEQASDVANESRTIDIIKANKAASLNQLGKQALQEAWDMEKSEKASRAANRFNQARSLFQQAVNVAPNPDNQSSLKMVTLKIEGNRLVNDGSKLEEEAYGLFQEAKKMNTTNNYELSKIKYKEALVKYRTAMEKFGQGKLKDGGFEESLTITNQLIRAVEQTIHDIDRAVLNYNLNHTNTEVTNQNNNHNGVVTTKTQVQIDA